MVHKWKQSSLQNGRCFCGFEVNEGKNEAVVERETHAMAGARKCFR